LTGYSKQPIGSTIHCQAFELCVLGSGSSGNSTLVRFGEMSMLIDAGFGPRATAGRLQQTGVGMGDLCGVCLTHLDGDHFKPTWVKALLRYRIRLYVHRRHLRRLYRLDGVAKLHEAGLLHGFNGEVFEPISGVCVRSVALPHDARGTDGFLLESQAGHIGYATDLGQVPQELIERFSGVHLLAIECNYDPAMQQLSDRPAFLKQRVMGHAGHLSNEQAFQAVQRIMQRSPHGGPEHVVLLHRSRQCNTRQLVQQVFERDGRIAKRLVLAEQAQRTDWLTVGQTVGSV